jgi:hypothetical protein
VRAAGVIQASGANLHSFGITSFAKSGTGVYDLTLSAATSAPVATATLFNGYIGNATVDFTSATVLRVRTFNTSGAPADQAFAVIVVSQ